MSDRIILSTFGQINIIICIPKYGIEFSNEFDAAEEENEFVNYSVYGTHYIFWKIAWKSASNGCKAAVIASVYDPMRLEPGNRVFPSIFFIAEFDSSSKIIGYVLYLFVIEVQRFKKCAFEENENSLLVVSFHSKTIVELFQS